MWSLKFIQVLNLFHNTGLYLFLLFSGSATICVKPISSHWSDSVPPKNNRKSRVFLIFSVVFRGNRNRPVTWYGLNINSFRTKKLQSFDKLTIVFHAKQIGWKYWWHLCFYGDSSMCRTGSEENWIIFSKWSWF